MEYAGPASDAAGKGAVPVFPVAFFVTGGQTPGPRRRIKKFLSFRSDHEL